MDPKLGTVIVAWEQLRVLFNLIIGSFGAWLSWGIWEEMGGLGP